MKPLVALSSLLFLVRCSGDLTEVIVHVDTSFSRMEVDGFDVRIYGPGVQKTRGPFSLVGPGAVTLPATFGILPKGGDARRLVTVAVDGMHGVSRVITATASFAFVSGQVTDVEIFLAKRGSDGADAGTSDAGTIDTGPIDAGPIDAGTIDAGDRDAGVGPDTGPVDGGPCPETYALSGASGSVYRVVLAPATWPEANVDCNDDGFGAHLAVLEELAENSFLLGLAPTTNTLWIGLTDARTEGTWEWVTGVARTYDNWEPTEPSGANCAKLQPTGWDSYDCLGQMNEYVCECDGRPPILP